jgi:hypothetical protein
VNSRNRGLLRHMCNLESVGEGILILEFRRVNPNSMPCGVSQSLR